MAKKIQINKEHNLTDLTNVAQAINPLLRQLLGNNGMVTLELLNSWQDIVGKDMSAYCWPQKIVFKKNERTDGCLNLNVLAGAFAMEIQQKQQQIIEKINVFFGYPAISKIKICQTADMKNFSIGKKNIDKVQKNVVSPEEESYITELIKDINDDELRQSLERIGRAVFARNKKQE